MRRLSHLPGSSQRVPARAADPSGIRPVASTPASAVPIDPAPPAGEGRPPRILVVEDDRALRDVLRFALADAGWDVEVAENGQHGLTRLAATDPDALILDVGLPDIDGL